MQRQRVNPTNSSPSNFAQTSDSPPITSNPPPNAAGPPLCAIIVEKQTGGTSAPTSAPNCRGHGERSLTLGASVVAAGSHAVPARFLAPEPGAVLAVIDEQPVALSAAFESRLTGGEELAGRRNDGPHHTIQFIQSLLASQLIARPVAHERVVLPFEAKEAVQERDVLRLWTAVLGYGA